MILHSLSSVFPTQRASFYPPTHPPDLRENILPDPHSTAFVTARRNSFELDINVQMVTVTAEMLHAVTFEFLTFMLLSVTPQ